MSLRNATTKLAAAMIVGSIVMAGFGAYWLLLRPISVLHGAIWQPVTYVFIETHPTSVLFSAVILISIGGALESWWGARRTVQLLVGVTIASGVAATLIALPFAGLRGSYLSGGGAMASSAWVAYGWTVGRARTSFWGISVTGNQLAAIGIGIVVAEAAFGSVFHSLPEAIAIALTYLHVHRSR